MFRKAIISVMILTLIVCCMGQTFQYSRGWTNGKRSSSNIHEDFPGLIIESDTEKKLEKCLINLQKILHGMYGYQALTNQMPSFMNKNSKNNNNNNNNHHHSNEIFDEFSTSESGNLIKPQTVLY